MARTKDGPKPGTGAPKKIVQPMLPALPLVPRKKKHQSGTEKQEKLDLNGSQAHPPANLESERAAEQAITPVTPDIQADNGTATNAFTTVNVNGPDTSSGSNTIDDRTTATSNSQTLPSTIEILDTSQESHKSVIALGHDPIEEVKGSPLPEIRIPQDDTKIVVEETKNDELKTAVNRFRQPSIASMVAKTVVDDFKGEQEAESIPNGVIAHGANPDTGGAPEAVTGYVETRTSTNHSATQSRSNSSIQRTPQHVFRFPNSPDFIISPQARGPLTAAHPSVFSSSTNGYVSPTGHYGASGGGPVHPFGQSTFPSINDHCRTAQYLSEWFDCNLCVAYPRSAYPAIIRGAASLFLIRSTRLRNFISIQRAGGFTQFAITFYPSRPIDPPAFDAALAFIYTDILLSTDRLAPVAGILDEAGRIRALNYAVSYMISGIELGIDPVINQALSSIDRLLDWDIAELAVKEAVDLREASTAGNNPHAPPTAAAAAKTVLQHVFNLMITKLDLQHFTLDTASSPTIMRSRLAFFESGRAVNPALAGMVFGSMPNSITSPTSSAAVSVSPSASPDTVASIIMLNCEFDDLREVSRVLHSVSGEHGVRVINEVLEERERRRIKVLNDRGLPNHHRINNSNNAAWEVIGLREYISDGIILREHAGFVRPLRRGSRN